MRDFTQKTQNFFSKKISQQNKKVLNQPPLLSSPNRQSLNMNEEQQQDENNDNQNNLMQFMRQVQKQGIPIRIQQTSNKKQDKQYEYNNEKDIDNFLLKNNRSESNKFYDKQGYFDTINHNIKHRVKVRDEKDLIKNKKSIQDRNNPNKKALVLNKLQKMKPNIGELREQIKQICNIIQLYKQQIIRQLQIMASNTQIKQLLQNKNAQILNCHITINSLKLKIYNLQNAIKQKQQALQKTSNQLQNMSNQNMQLSQKIFDLNQKVIQMDLIKQQQIKQILNQYKLKLHEQPYSQHIRNKRNIVKSNYFETANHYQPESIVTKNKQISRKRIHSQSTSSAKARQFQTINDKEYRHRFKNELKINENQSHNAQRQQLNTSQINNKINQIKIKYKTFKPYSPKVQANVYNQSYNQLTHTKSQKSYPYNLEHSLSQTNSPKGADNTYNNNYNNIIRNNQFNTSNGDAHRNGHGYGHAHGYGNGVKISGVFNPKRVGNQREKSKDARRKNQRVMQDSKIDWLGVRIDELRSQIKKQIDLTR